MKRIISVVLTLVCLLGIFSFTVSAEESVIYVSTSGSDLKGDGSENAPYATIKKAKDIVKDIPKTAPITVVIKEGAYYASESLKFVSTDNGAVNAEVTYKADGNVVITGKKTISASDFSLVTDPEMLLRMRREVRGKVYELDLKEHSLGELNRAVLFINGEKQQEARYPNGSYMAESNADGDNAITISDSRVYEWENAKNAYATGSFGAKYFWGDTNVVSFKDGVMTISRPTTDTNNKINFFVSNLIEEIDAVGEFAVNNETGMLLCYLPDGYENMKFEVINPAMTSPYVNMSNVEYINFDGITFDKLSKAAFKLSNTNNINITNCNFDYIQSSYAININNSNDVSVSDNTAYGCSGGLVNLSGCGDYSTLEAGNVVISNNYVSNCGDKLAAINAIISGGTNDGSTIVSVGNKIINNVIGNSSTVYAITFPGNNNDIQYNEIYNIARQVSDGGAIYFGRSLKKRGNDVSYNYIHHLNTGNMYSGVYLDDGYSGINVHHNVFYKMYHPIHLGLGMDVKINNNISVFTGKGILSGTRMTYFPNKNNALYKEIESLFSNEARKEVYLNAYPEMEEILTRTPFFAPYNSQITGNLIYDSINNFWQSAHHSYYNTDGTVKISGEDTVEKITDEMKADSGLVISEIPIYGAEITNANGESLNATKLGNPLEHSNNHKDDDNIKMPYFRDYDNQDFTLTDTAKSVESYINSGSTAGDIDMSLIGIKNGTNTNAFKNETDFEVYPSYSDGKLIVKWDRLVGASVYEITIGDSDPVTVYDDNLNASYETSDIIRGESYDITVTASGIARNNPVSVTKNVTYTVPAELDTSSLDYAVSLLNEEAESGRVYTDETVSGNLSALYSEVSGAEYSSEEEIVNAETEIYDLLVYASETRDESITGITKCEAANSGTYVQVAAEGFKPYSLITVLVTNPNYSLNNLTSDNEEIVRYTNISSANSNGSVKFEFDTKLNDVDYLGEYRVYVSGSDGTVLDSTYVYGTVETDEAVFTVDNAEVPAEELYNYAGKTVKVQIPVTSRIGVDINPSLICGFYNSEGKLLGVEMNNSNTLVKNSVTFAELSLVIPKDYSKDCRAELMIFDEDMLLKPLSLKRVITEK